MTNDDIRDELNYQKIMYKLLFNENTFYQDIVYVILQLENKIIEMDRNG